MLTHIYYMKKIDVIISEILMLRNSKVPLEEYKGTLSACTKGGVF